MDDSAPSLAQAARALGIDAADLSSYGDWAAKVSPNALARPRKRAGRGKLILVSAITPTPAGEGKTTTSIGLADALTIMRISSSE